ncbi:MAG: hypothetical protein ACYSWY_08050 [Planctomycetota bacterium]|jgi:type I restriction enzyme R subunit
MSTSISEDTIEQAALDWFEGLGYAVLYGPDIAPGEPASERRTFGDVVLVDRPRSALECINPDVTRQSLQD